MTSSHQEYYLSGKSILEGKVHEFEFAGWQGNFSKGTKSRKNAGGGCERGEKGKKVGIME